VDGQRHTGRVTTLDEMARVHRRRPGRTEAGVTLVELLVAVVILGLVGVVFGGSLAMVTYSSAFHDTQALMQGVLNDAAERVRATGYVPCAEATGYQPVVAELGGKGVIVAVTAVDFPALKRSPSGGVTIDWDPDPPWSGCDDDHDQEDPGLQRVHLRVSHPDFEPLEVDVLKRSP